MTVSVPLLWHDSWQSQHTASGSRHQQLQLKLGDVLLSTASSCCKKWQHFRTRKAQPMHPCLLLMQVELMPMLFHCTWMVIEAETSLYMTPSARTDCQHQDIGVTLISFWPLTCVLRSTCACSVVMTRSIFTFTNVRSSCACKTSSSWTW